MTCEKCGDSGWIETIKDGEKWMVDCPCKEEKWLLGKLENRLKNCGVPVRFRDSTFDNFVVTPKNKEAYTAGVKFADGTADVNSVVLLGLTNTGKTHLLTAAVLKMVREGHNAVYITVMELLAKMRRGMVDNTIEDIIEEYKTAEILALDDWGTTVHSDWGIGRLEEIIERRYANNLPTIVASNIQEEDFPERTRNRLAGRGWSRFVVNREKPRG